MFEPKSIIAAELAKYMYAEGLLSDKQYNIALSKVGAYAHAYNSNSARYLIKHLRHLGFDSIAFMNERYDPGSIGLIIFDGSKLIPVAVDGLPVENSDRTLADSNEPAFFISENDGEKFVKNDRNNFIDDGHNSEYNKCTLSKLSESDKIKIKQMTNWSDEIINYIRSMNEAQLYINANLKETEINDRKCLIRSDIDINYKDLNGITNKERINKKRSPIMPNNEEIHLHHIGQEENSPLAELTLSEHLGKGNYSILHDVSKPSKIDRIKFGKTKPIYWKIRFNIGGY